MNFPCFQKNKEDNNNNVIAMLLLARNQIPACFWKVGSIVHGPIITRMVWAAQKKPKDHAFHPVLLSFGCMFF